MPHSIAAAKVGVTTGEWAGVMRYVYGEYRGPTGVSRSPSNKTEGLDDLRAEVDAVSDRLGRRLKFLMGKPGLDGHSNGAEQIAFHAAFNVDFFCPYRCNHSALLMYGQGLIMANGAFHPTSDQQIFLGSDLASNHQRWTDD